MGRLLCIEVDKYNIKIVEALRKGEILSVLNCLTLKSLLNTEDIDYVANIIRNELELNNIKAKKAIFIINSSSIIMRKIKLPFLKRNSETLSMIRNELEQLISVDLQQYKIIYKTININDNSNINNAYYVVYCLPVSIYNKYIELSKKLKLKLICIDVSYNCLNKIYKHNIKINDEALYLENIYAFINIDLHWCSFCILNKGVNDFSKTIDYNNGYGETVEEETEYYGLNNSSNSFNSMWFDEICKYIRYYHSLNNENCINKIYIYGEGSENKDINQYLSKNLNVEVSKIFTISNKDFNGSKTFIDVNHYFNSILALFRDDNDGCFCNENNNSKYGIKTYTTLIVAASLIVIIAGFYIMFYSNALLRNKINDLNMYINDKNNMEQNYQIEKIKKDNLSLEALLNEIEIVQELVSNSDYISLILKEIYDAIPLNTKVTSILIDNNNTILTCLSGSMEDVTIFMQNLRTIKELDSIHVPTIEANQSEHLHYSYTVILQLKDVNNSGY